MSRANQWFSEALQYRCDDDAHCDALMMIMAVMMLAMPISMMMTMMKVIQIFEDEAPDEEQQTMESEQPDLKPQHSLKQPQLLPDKYCQ